ncbi:universal stress protein [Conexibacter arvalis]|uniref:Nucleotide-binding universal stress UspA family protein n=1 Tax=Conexibacter arvalis TaxID=912552 RepID=A0A840IIE9_9ACTN|nr:universal stress protein [Conexibacter arvalis]MBB4664762.1 nucleotide-binding universal stress UspA family protein [Conexibacter arvalis]
MRLLCGLDHSTTSLAAACFAAGVARRLGAELTVVHVVEPPATARGARARAPLPEPAGYTADALAERARSLAELTGAQVSVRIEHGPVAPTLARLAAKEGCDLLVVGSGRGGALTEIWRSGVARQLAAAPPCPVALVPEEATSARVERIVVGCDGSAAAQAATAAAGRLAFALDAEVVLLHQTRARTRPTGWERYDEERRRRRAGRAAVGRGVALHVAERSGDPVATLAEPVDGDDGDAWVVVGQRRRRRMSRLRRPLASRVADRSRQPVIAVPA